MSFELYGRLTYRFRNLLLLLWVSFLVMMSRLRHGPRLSAWPLRDLIGQQGRELLDALFEPTAPQWLLVNKVTSEQVLR